ncbi:exodeoxyribonuclease III [Acidihalobacter aeolianus]|uniref:Exodeoxyribonuclease III n=1 Tax=Acidihalobacter aeolianus TaxID=2792603 RepID=A0A1D8K3X4_9GAMM|nr:exodeoxyribonuclease III [Acidihalobacter aeolianus]AOV15661.1 exodeoxyribonuclease III [Acidihalobacter aeolianus]
MVLKVASWNVNSLNVRLPHVLQWLDSEKPDIVGLQETKLQDEKFPYRAFVDQGYEAVYSGQKTYNGVALLAKQGHELRKVLTDIPNMEDPQRRIIAAEIAGIRILNLYVVNGQAVGTDKYDYKLDWLERVTAFIEADMKKYPKYMIMGDFNIAPDDADVHDPEAWKDQILCSSPERAALDGIKELGFKDTFRLFEQKPQSFSWWDYRAAAFRRNIGLRIDLLLASDQLATSCTGSWVDREPRTWERPSDHAPVICEFDLADFTQSS